MTELSLIIPKFSVSGFSSNMRVGEFFCKYGHTVIFDQFWTFCKGGTHQKRQISTDLWLFTKGVPYQKGQFLVDFRLFQRVYVPYQNVSFWSIFDFFQRALSKRADLGRFSTFSKGVLYQKRQISTDFWLFSKGVPYQKGLILVDFPLKPPLLFIRNKNMKYLSDLPKTHLGCDI